MTDLSFFEKREREKARELRRSAWWKNIRAKGICHYCQKQFPPEQITMDHLIPIAAGGQSVKSNIVPACKQCNTEKAGNDPLEELFERIKNEKGSD